MSVLNGVMRYSALVLGQRVVGLVMSKLVNLTVLRHTSVVMREAAEHARAKSMTDRDKHVYMRLEQSSEIGELTKDAANELEIARCLIEAHRKLRVKMRGQSIWATSYVKDELEAADKAWEAYAKLEET
jgi:hypothetical protein